MADFLTANSQPWALGFSPLDGPWTPLDRVGWAKQGNAGRARGYGQVRNRSIWANIEESFLEQMCRLSQCQLPTE